MAQRDLIEKMTNRAGITALFAIFFVLIVLGSLSEPASYAVQSFTEDAQCNNFATCIWNSSQSPTDSCRDVTNQSQLCSFGQPVEIPFAHTLMQLSTAIAFIGVILFIIVYFKFVR